MFGYRGIMNCQPERIAKNGEIFLYPSNMSSISDFKNKISELKQNNPEITLVNAQLYAKLPWDNTYTNAISEFFSKLTSLQTLTLNLSNSNINNTILQQLLDSLINLKHVEKFTILIHQCEQLTQGYLSIIFRYLQQTKTQTYVQIANGENQSNGSDFKILADYIIHNPKLEELNLQSFENSYDQEAHSYLCKALAKNTHLLKLTLQTITEPNQFWDNLYEGLKENSTLERFFVRILGGGNQKKMAIGLNNILQTISSSTILVTAYNLESFQQLQNGKKEGQLQLTAFYKHILPYLTCNPNSIAADLHYD